MRRGKKNGNDLKTGGFEIPAGAEFEDQANEEEMFLQTDCLTVSLGGS